MTGILSFQVSTTIEVPSSINAFTGRSTSFVRNPIGDGERARGRGGGKGAVGGVREEEILRGMVRRFRLRLCSSFVVCVPNTRVIPLRSPLGSCLIYKSRKILRETVARSVVKL